MSNKAFTKRVKKCIGGMNLMKLIGFQERGGYLTLGRIEPENLKKWIEILADYVENKVIVVE
jgi:hypothetical protein